MRSGEAQDLSLCRYKHLSCIRCCLPHIGGDSYLEGPNRYLGPGGLVMVFRNFNPLQDPKIAASQYEDSFPDVGRVEMEKRFSKRRSLFLTMYDPDQPRQSLAKYMNAAQKNEGYRYKPKLTAGPGSIFLGGSVPKHPQKGELPECQLLGFVDAKGRVGCMAHPCAETSRGHDGRDEIGFFAHTGCCRNVGCEASKEFGFLTASAMKIFDQAVEGMSWYQYSRHATSVLVYYLRGYDHLLQQIDEGRLLDSLNLKKLVKFTNALYDGWPLRKPNLFQAPRDSMTSLDILRTDLPLTERLMYLALDTRFSSNDFGQQLQQARDHIQRHIAVLRRWRFTQSVINRYA
jgi:hypothetical protein